MIYDKTFFIDVHLKHVYDILLTINNNNVCYNYVIWYMINHILLMCICWFIMYFKYSLMLGYAKYKSIKVTQLRRKGLVGHLLFMGGFRDYMLCRQM